MSERSTAAERLAQIHYQSESTSEVYEYSAHVGGSESNEPIKLLEVNRDTIASGIVPLSFGPLPEADIFVGSTIIEVTPEEHEQIKNGNIRLPEGWEEYRPIPKAPETAGTDR